MRKTNSISEITDFDRVVLIVDKPQLPKGSRGTVMCDHAPRQEFDVGFTEPVPIMIIVQRSEMIKEIPPVRFTYTNYRGETSIRNVILADVRWGHTEWHPEDCALLRAFDLDKNEIREFAAKDCDFTKTE